MKNKKILQEGMSETEFYGDFVYKFRKIVGELNFSEQFKKIVTRYKKVCCNMDTLRKTANMVVNVNDFDNVDSLFNRKTVIRSSD